MGELRCVLEDLNLEQETLTNQTQVLYLPEGSSFQLADGLLGSCSRRRVQSPRMLSWVTNDEGLHGKERGAASVCDHSELSRRELNEAFGSAFEVKGAHVSVRIYSSGVGTVINGTGTSRFFNVFNGAQLELSNVKLYRGAAQQRGGAIYVFGENSFVHIVDSVIADSHVLVAADSTFKLAEGY